MEGILLWETAIETTHSATPSTFIVPRSTSSTSLKPSANKPNELVGAASVIDAAGEPGGRIAATFKLGEDAATITFTQRMPKGQFILDGWYEQYKILRSDGRGFFGTWFTETGPTVPWKGYFCARLR